MAAPYSLDALLADRDFVHRLVGKLLAPSDLEDVAQEANLAALQRPPQGRRRPWLAAVIRRMALLERRSSAARIHRERVAARPEMVASAAEIVAREEQRQHLVRTVVELPTAEREVILLRYFEGLLPQAIAAHEGVPVQTVKTRLKRGLARLRDRLEHSGTDWRPALAFLAVPSPREPAVAASLGVLLMSTKSVTAVTLVLASLVGVMMFEMIGNRPPNAPGGAPVPPNTTMPDLGDPRGVPVHRIEDSRRRIPSVAQGATIRGHVVGEFGEALGQVTVGLHCGGVQEQVQAAMIPQLSFEFEIGKLGSYELSLAGPDGYWAKPQSVLIDRLGTQYDVTLWAEPLPSLGIRFVDEQGNLEMRVGGGRAGVMPYYSVTPLAIATLDRPSDTIGSVPIGIDMPIPWGVGVYKSGLNWTSPSGIKTPVCGVLNLLSPLPVVVSAVVGEQVVASTMVIDADEPVEFVLDSELLEAASYELFGQVVDAESRVPLAGGRGIALFRDPDKRAYVLGELDENGRFRLTGIPAGAWFLLIEIQGFERVMLPVHLGPSLDAELGEIALREAAVVTGRVVDAGEKPVRARVWVGTAGKNAEDQGLGKYPDHDMREDGYFGLFQLPPEILVIGIEANPDWAFRPVLLDGALGVLSDVKLVVQEGVELLISCNTAQGGGSKVVLRDERRLAYWIGTMKHGKTHLIRVPVGTYVLEWATGRADIHALDTRVEVQIQ